MDVPLGKSDGYLKAQFDLKRREERRGRAPFITISRQPGAYGLSVASRVAEYLNARERRVGANWHVFDRELVQRVVEENRYPKDIIPLLEECPVSEIDDAIEEMFGLHPSKWTLVQKMSRVILHLACGGYVILVGRASNIVTRRLSGGVHLRLVGSFASRLRHVRERYGYDDETARAFLKQEEVNRAGYVRKYFDRDVEDPLLYDFVINTDTVPVDRIAVMAGEFVLGGGHLRGEPRD